MANLHEEAAQAGRLIQFGLQPKALPFEEPEYRDLLRQYEDRVDFRTLVQGMTEGLGLVILLVNERGLFLGTHDESVFAQSPSTFRGPQVSGDDRLLDGLVELAIAATLFPRQRDLEDDVLAARPPLTVTDVDSTLRELVEALKQQQPNEPGVDADRIDQGLWEAWQVYDSRPSHRRTGTGRASANSTFRIIEQHLDRLCELGCFTADRHDETVRYRPTLRYQVLVQELAATRLYGHIQKALQQGGEEPRQSDTSTIAAAGE